MEIQIHSNGKNIFHQSPVADIIEKIIMNSKWFPISKDKINSEISRQLNTQKRQSVEQILKSLVDENVIIEIETQDSKTYYHSGNLAAIVDKLISIIRNFHKDKPFKTGISRSEIRKYISSNKQKKKQKAICSFLLDYMIEIALEKNLIKCSDNVISLPDFVPNENLKQRILNFIENRDFMYKIERETIHKEFNITISEFNSIIFNLKEDGTIMTIQKGYFMTSNCLIEYKRIICNHIVKNGPTHIRELTDMFNSSRRPMSIFLDYLDSINFLKMVDGKRDLV